MSHFVSEFCEDTLSRIYAETPGLAGRNHLDSAGSSFMSVAVIDAMQAAFDREVKFGGYVAQEQQTEALEASYHALAQLLGGKTSDYAFVGNAVDGWTKAFYSLPFKKGDVIVTAYNEYCANYIAYLQVSKNKGVEIRVARSLPGGGIDIDHMESLIDANTRLISVSHMPSSSGEIIQAAEIGRLAKAKGVLFQLDACQSTGHVPIDVKQIGCDIMTGTSRKFLRGPRGIGFLYVNEQARSQMEPVILTNMSAEWSSLDAYSLRDDARIFEAWERSVINQVGFGAAINYLLELGVERATAQIRNNASYLRTSLAALDSVSMVCPESAKSAIITFNIDGIKPAEVKSRMEKRGIAVQVAKQAHTRLDYEVRDIHEAVRVSPHYYTPKIAMDDFLSALGDIQNGR
ncbi:aminotransferase class V-fold PLP-dependent enzyme [Kordiimonas aquimaris]|uniref:aminotransferase class V-fold PLP-dependent enzyme n=1 Tax=Kordiimonas aquimaris TaxID=707591 RepID=UPI0021D3C405|nr:aminotransferase class V-fold PLP-dependent enzyme [Kordiimonas aquimaris]